MARCLLEDALAHHAWATVRLIDACGALTPAEIGAPARGTFGSILQTLRHIVDSDSFELLVATGVMSPLVNTDDMELPHLGTTMEANGARWRLLLGDNPDPDAVIREIDPDDGFQRDATWGIRLAHALHHGAEHRSQVCTALTLLGREPPDISPWQFGIETGRASEVYPNA